MKYLNIKQDIKEVRKSFKLLKDRVRDFIKKHLLFEQGIKSFFILSKWIILLALIIYSFWYFPYLWKKLKIIEYQKNLTLLEQELQDCMDTYSVSRYEIHIEESFYYFPYEDPKIIAKSNDEEFDKYNVEIKQYENKLLKQIAICYKKPSVLEKRAEKELEQAKKEAEKCWEDVKECKARCSGGSEKNQALLIRCQNGCNEERCEIYEKNAKMDK